MSFWGVPLNPNREYLLSADSWVPLQAGEAESLTETLGGGHWQQVALAGLVDVEALG